MDLSNLPRQETYADKVKSKKLDIMDQLVLSSDLRRFNLDAIRKACTDLGLDTTNRSNDEMLALAHQVRLKLITTTDAEKRASEDWLRFRNYSILPK